MKLLEDTFGAIWRSLEKERRFFSHRKLFYNAIKTMPKELNILEGRQQSAGVKETEV